MRRAALLLAATMLAAPAFAQTPFDMSPELPAGQRPATSVPTGPTGPVVPSPGPRSETTSSTAAEQMRRFLVPAQDMTLSGEDVTRAWAVYLTAAQAGSPATLSVGYQNSVLVAPEASSLIVSVNGSNVLNFPIRSSDKATPMMVELPAGLLRPGLNDLKLQAVQRHRTDCTIPSTYELWTRIDPTTTYLGFSSPDAARWSTIEDLRSIGVDTTGHTTLNIVVPALGQTPTMQPLARLAQTLALVSGMPNQVVNVTAGPIPAPQPGAATILLGTATELRDLRPDLPQSIGSQASASIAGTTNLIVVGGPTWATIAAEVDSLAATVDRAANSQRQTLGTRAWQLPDAPMLYSEAKLTLAQLGVPTQEFNGRRFRTEFSVGVPSDFFANAYGETSILLDAAYSSDVLPSSHIDVYVNNSIASTVPITTSGGEILRHLPVKVSMRHFRPGLNRIAVEAVLLTEADAACAPGATARGGSRFVLFDTSEFNMPTFARIGQLPNLAALSGTGFPYSRESQPIPIVIDRPDATTLSAATTLLARVAIAATRVIPVEFNASAATVADRSAVFFGPIGQLPDVALRQVGIAADAKSGWQLAAPGATDGSQEETQATFDTWRDRLQDSGWRGQVSYLQDWLERTFGVDMDSFRLGPAEDIDYFPTSSATFMAAQQLGPSGTGTWTVFTAPTSETLIDGIRAVTVQENWRQLGGHISIYRAGDRTVDTIPVRRYGFIETQPASFYNYRLILANFLSGNAMSYSLLLAAGCVTLGLATVGLLGRLGRRR